MHRSVLVSVLTSVVSVSVTRPTSVALVSVTVTTLKLTETRLPAVARTTLPSWTAQAGAAACVACATVRLGPILMR